MKSFAVSRVLQGGPNGVLYITPISWDEITPVFTHIVLTIFIRTFIGVIKFRLVYDDRLGALLTNQDGIRTIFEAQGSQPKPTHFATGILSWGGYSRSNLCMKKIWYLCKS